MYEERESSEYEEMIRLIHLAKRLVFIGFGYHEKNLELLALRKNCSNGARIIATYFKLAAGEKERVMERLRIYSQAQEHDVMISHDLDADALSFLKNYNLLL